MCDQYGRPAPVTADQLGPRLGQHDQLRLLILNACHTAGASDDGGLARRLVRQDVADVVAMQRDLSDMAAASFSKALYGQLGFGTPLDQAVATARVAMADDHTTEWATPVLFMRSPDGRLFQRSSTTRTAKKRDASQPTDDLDRRRADLESQVALGGVVAAYELANRSRASRLRTSPARSPCTSARSPAVSTARPVRWATSWSTRWSRPTWSKDAAFSSWLPQPETTTPQTRWVSCYPTG